jgi:hypothetical protein
MEKLSKKQLGVNLSETIYDAVYEVQTLLHTTQLLRENADPECAEYQIDVLQNVVDEKLELALEGAHLMEHYFKKKPATGKKSTAIVKAA